MATYIFILILVITGHKFNKYFAQKYFSQYYK